MKTKSTLIKKALADCRWRFFLKPNRWVTLVTLFFLFVYLLVARPSAVSADGGIAGGTESSQLLYEKDVRPIFKAMCFHCHGEEPELAGGIDTRLVRLMVAGGDSGPGLVPGNSSDSLLWKRIESDEMPEGAKKLTPKEKETIKLWIEHGAKTARTEPEKVEDARFTDEELSLWAFQPPTSPVVPTIDTESL